MVTKGVITTEGAQGLVDRLDPAIHKRLLASSCAYFAQEVLSGDPNPPYNGKFLVNSHHLEWDTLVRTHKRLCVLASRDHGKTFFFDFAYPLWRAFHKPNRSTYIFSATENQAIRILDDIKKEVEGNPVLEWLVPHKATKWSSTILRFSNGHTIYAKGFGTRIRGAHPECIIVDDGLSDNSAISETIRKKEINYFLTAITNMIIPSGQIVVVGTPMHSQDLYGTLKKNKTYHYARYPAIKSNGEALWPDRYNLKALTARRQEIGSINFGREFLVNPISDEMSLFPKALFKGPPMEQYNYKLGMPLDYWENVGITVYIGVDFAISSNVGADFMVVFVVGVDDHKNRWLIDISKNHGLAYKDQLSLLNTYNHKYKPVLMFLEANQMQRIFGDELIRLTDLPIKQFTTTKEKHSLEKGIPAIRILLENSKYRIPRGDSKSVELTDDWIDQMHNFTFDKGKVVNVGDHDDIAMANYICEQAIAQGGFQFSFGDDYIDDKNSLEQSEQEKAEPDDLKPEKLSELMVQALPNLEFWQ